MRTAALFGLKKWMDPSPEIADQLDRVLRCLLQHHSLKMGYLDEEVEAFYKWLKAQSRKHPRLAVRCHDEIKNFRYNYMRYVLLSRIIEQRPIKMPFAIEPYELECYIRDLKQELLEYVVETSH